MSERILTITPVENRAQVGYDILFDIADYQNLYQQRDQLTPLEFERKKSQLDALKRHNFQSALGERFNAEVSQVTYQLVNDQLFNTDHDEPFLEIIKRGQKHREQHGSAEVKREKAEVLGFAATQALLTHPHFEGKVIIISPRGGQESIYPHNYFDVYSKNPAGTITMSRLTCKFNYGQFRQAALTTDPFADLPTNPTDADFLATPLITYQSLAEIQQIFHPAEDVLPLVEYHKLLEICAPFITSYLNALASQTCEPNQIIKIYNSILNVADEFVLKPATRRKFLELVQLPYASLTPTIEYYSRLPVRLVAAGCGLQTGFAATGRILTLGLTSAPWSVAEFGRNTCQDCGGVDNHFHCPGCGGQIPSGLGITTCPHCALTKEQAGSKCA